MKKILGIMLVCGTCLFGCGVDDSDYVVEKNTLDGMPSYEITFDEDITESEAKYYIESGRFAEDMKIIYPNYWVWFEIDGNVVATIIEDYQFHYWFD